MNIPPKILITSRPGARAWRALRRLAGVIVPAILLAGVLPELNAQTAPVFTTQPVSQGVLIGSAATFSVTVTGSPTPTLQWLRNGTTLAGQTTATLTLASVTLADGGVYTVRATNSVGTVLSSGATLTVLPGLERYGPLLSLASTPTNPRPGYPEWYQDTTGLTLELLTPKSLVELQGGYDVILPTDTTFNATLGGEPWPTGWFLEHFYYYARSEFAIGAERARMEVGLEGTFGNGFNVVPGDEVVFTRIRFTLVAAPSSGDYLILTPYSQQEVKNVTAGGKLRFVEDIGIGPAPAGFAGALRSKVGPFMTASNTPGGPELPLHIGPDGRQYLADPLRIGPVTGSPFGPSRNGVQVFYKPSGTTTYPLTPQWSSTDWVLYGRVKNTPIPTRTSVDRVTKTVNGTDRRLDVFASADSTLPIRVPPAAPATKRTPVLSFVVPGTTTKFTMISAASPTTPTTYYWYQWPMTLAQSNAATTAIGSKISVQDDSDPITPAVFTGTIRDAVWSVSTAAPVALWTPGTSTLTVKCDSSTGAITATALPSALSPNLISLPYSTRTYNNTTKTLTLTGITAPPADIIVASPVTGGGSDVFPVAAAQKP